MIQNFKLSDLVDIKTLVSQETCLHVACGCNKPHLIRSFIGLGADPRTVDVNGNTPLQVAVKYGNDKCVAKLLEFSNNLFNVDSINNKGQTALHMAVWESNLAIVKQLVKAKASVHLTERSQGYDILHIAVKTVC